MKPITIIEISKYLLLLALTFTIIGCSTPQPVKKDYWDTVITREWRDQAERIDLIHSPLAGSKGTIYYQGKASGSYADNKESWTGEIVGQVVWISQDGKFKLYTHHLIIYGSRIECPHGGELRGAY